jgi:hypothetical protein
MSDPMAIVLAQYHRLGATYEVVDLGDKSGDCDVFKRHARANIHDTPVVVRCTLMHELRHIERGDIPTGNPDLDAPMEAEADRWAAEILISDVMLTWALNNGRDERERAEMLGVDPATYEAKLLAAATRQAVQPILKAEVI